MSDIIEKFVDATTFSLTDGGTHHLVVAEEGLPTYTISPNYSREQVAANMGLWIGSTVVAEALKLGYISAVIDLRPEHHLEQEIDLTDRVVGLSIASEQNESDQKLLLRAFRSVKSQSGRLPKLNPTSVVPYNSVVLALNRGTGDLNVNAPIIVPEGVERPLWGCLAWAAVDKHVTSLDPKSRIS